MGPRRAVALAMAFLYFRRISVWLTVLLSVRRVRALSTPDQVSERRSFLWKIPLGIGATYGYGRLAYNAFQVMGIKYPKKHEDRIERVLREAIPTTTARPLRILELGVGKECRLTRRGFYNRVLSTDSEVELVGLDVLAPSRATANQARQRLPSKVTFQSTQGSITDQSTWDTSILKDNSFDVVISCLTLCSVDDPSRAAQNIRLLLHPGGRFGYIEHVAVESDEPYRLLEWQQHVLDPLQQRLADNCHLRRRTEDTLRREWEDAAQILYQERFLVDSMWPITCQCAGVVQLA